MSIKRRFIAGLLGVFIFTGAFCNSAFYCSATEDGLTKTDNLKGRVPDGYFSYDSIMWSPPYETPVPEIAAAWNQENVYGKVDIANAYKPYICDDFETMKQQYNMQYLSWGGVDRYADYTETYKPYGYCDFLDYNLGPYTDFQSAMDGMFPGWTQNNRIIYSKEGINISDNANMVEEYLSTYGYCQAYSFSIPRVQNRRLFSVKYFPHWEYGYSKEITSRYTYTDAQGNQYNAIAGQKFSPDDFVILSDFYQLRDYYGNTYTHARTYNNKPKATFLFVDGVQSDTYVAGKINAVICFYISANHPYFFPVEDTGEYPKLIANTDNLIECMVWTFIPYSGQ